MGQLSGLLGYLLFSSNDNSLYTMAQNMLILKFIFSVFFCKDMMVVFA